MIVLAVNIIAFLCLIFFSIPYLTHDTTVYHPNAMLPAEAWDDAGMALTIGFIPLLTANGLAFMRMARRKGNVLSKALCFAPSFMCMCLVISYFMISFE